MGVKILKKRKLTKEAQELFFEAKSQSSNVLQTTPYKAVGH